MVELELLLEEELEEEELDEELEEELEEEEEDELEEEEEEEEEELEVVEMVEVEEVGEVEVEVLCGSEVYDEGLINEDANGKRADNLDKVEGPVWHKRQSWWSIKRVGAREFLVIHSWHA